MYRSGSPREMKPAELEQARLGFNQYLRRKRFSPQFIARHGEELFATAMLEYSRKLAEGAKIENPPGWLITCAWQRTKSLLEAEDRTPRVVSTERVPSLADEREHGPEDAALEEDRFRKVQHAVAQLSEDERRLLELSYFEGLAVREVARVLDWHPSKAQRCHEAAQKHLHKLLGVESLDELIIEIGLAAYVSFIGASSVGLHLPTGTFEAAIEAVGRGTSAAWARAQDIARRLPFGGGAESSAGAALQGGVGRVAGACATAAVAACLAASGVVGPGVGGLLNGGSSAHAHRPKPPDRVALAPRRAPIAPQPHSTSRPVPEPRSTSSGGGQRQAKNSSASASAQRTRRATRESASQLAVESEVVPEEEASSPTESSAPTSSSAGASSSTPTQISNEQFGP